MQPRLTVRDLACRRGDRLLFRGLSFALAAGEAMQIVGANGTGKSSLLRLLAGLLRPLAGSVEATGRMALLDDRLPLDEHQPLGTALGFWAAIDGTSRSADHLALNQLSDVPVRFLSTGQRKRAAYAAAAAGTAPIRLLDEPLNGLDTDFVAALTHDLEGFRAQGGIVVVASHQPLALRDLRTTDLAGFAG